MELDILKARKRRRAAAGILAAVIILGAVFGCLRSVAARRNAALSEFNRDVGIATDLATRAERSYDLVTVAKRYLPADDPALAALTDARSALDDAKTTQQKYQANQALTQAAAQVSGELEQCQLSKKDEGYRSSIMAELESRNATISHDEYNDLAREYNERVLGAFPASLIAGSLGMKELAVFR